jgi:hypothetical protein
MAFRQGSSIGAVLACAALLAGTSCTVTPEPRRPEPPPAPRAATPPPADAAPEEPVPPPPKEIGDTAGADALEALRWVAALFATGIDTRSETDPLGAWNRADRSAAGAMGSAPGAAGAAEAASIVDGVLDRYREGDPAAKDPRGDAEKPVPDPAPEAPPKDTPPPKPPPGEVPPDRAGAAFHAIAGRAASA